MKSKKLLEIVLNQINLRTKAIQLELQQAVEVDEIMIYQAELDKSLRVIERLNAFKEQSDEEAVENTNSYLELQAFKEGRILEDKIKNKQKLTAKDIDKWNESIHTYNLFTNILHSI